MRTRSKLIPLILVLAMCSFATFAQQTGSIAGTARTADGQVLPGVTVEARSSVLPQPRTTTTSTTGEFRFPQLPPAAYVVRFTLDGIGTQSRNVKVLLGQEARAEVTMGLEGLSEAMTVTAQATLVDTTSQEIRSALGEEILELPVGQEYRDLVKLIPAVQYTEDATRGPSAGASGQDNVYNFDGVTRFIEPVSCLSESR